MKKKTSLSFLMLLVLSLALAACASGPKETAPKATPEEIAAAEAEVQQAEANLAAAEAEARQAGQVAAEDRSAGNIAVFMEKKDAWDAANETLNKAKAKLRKLKS
jgi:uncharacterized lipoprotein YajG